MPRRTVSAIVALLALGCAASPRQEDPSAVRQIVDRTNAQLEAWYRAGQVDSIVSVFAADVWQMPPNMPPVIGNEALRQFWSDAVSWGEWNFDLESQEVVVSGALAVERGKFTLAFEPGPNAPPPMSSGFQDRGNYVVLWRREADGIWRIVWDAPVSELPPGGTP